MTVTWKFREVKEFISLFLVHQRHFEPIQAKLNRLLFEIKTLYDFLKQPLQLKR